MTGASPETSSAITAAHVSMADAVVPNVMTSAVTHVMETGIASQYATNDEVAQAASPDFATQDARGAIEELTTNLNKSSATQDLSQNDGAAFSTPAASGGTWAPTRSWLRSI